MSIITRSTDSLLKALKGSGFITSSDDTNKAFRSQARGFPLKKYDFWAQFDALGMKKIWDPPLLSTGGFFLLQ